MAPAPSRTNHSNRLGSYSTVVAPTILIALCCTAAATLNMANSTSAKDENTEYNKKLNAYAFIAITSLINFASVAEGKNLQISASSTFGRNPAINLMWGVITFTLSLLIILSDVADVVRNKFDFKTVMDGKLEGYTLLLFVLFWAVGVACLTRAGGLGYSALNVYFSAWITFFGTCFTLNLWLGEHSEKGYVTIQQMCRLSATLPYWWILWFASIVTFSSGADARRLLVNMEEDLPDAESSCNFAIGVGLVSFVFSSFFILSHYEFLQTCTVCKTWMTYGGIFELACIIIVDIWQVISVQILTSAGNIASTVTGKGELNANDFVPGSNIYFATWTSLISSVMVTVKWKQARAIKFAQTQQNEGREGLDNDDEEEN